MKCWLYLIALSLLSPASALDLPQFDLASLGGNLGLLGSFSAISAYTTDNATQFLSTSNNNNNNNNSSSSSGSLYLQDLITNSVQKIAEVQGGSLNTLHTLNDGSVLINGDFNQFTSASSSASQSKDVVTNTTIVPPLIYNSTSGQHTAIFNSSSQINGSVTTILVDNDLIYLGGDFQFNNTYGAAIYNITSKQVYNTPFQGFGKDSAVNTIVKILDDATSDNSNVGSIVFGGDFNTLGLKNLLVHNVTSNSSVRSNNTNTSLITAEQVISLKNGIFTQVSGQSSDSSLDTLICPETSSGWSVQPGQGGEWAVELPAEMQGLTPTKVRLFVPELGDNGVKLFRIYSYPNNGIMNLSYIDPLTNTIAYCDAWCPLEQFTQLSNATKINQQNANTTDYNGTTFVDSTDGSFSTYYDPSTKTKSLGYSANYQEFAFIDQLPIDKVGLTVIDWYGSQGTIQGFELFLDSIIVYGNNTLNEPNCASDDDTSNYSKTKGGNWESVLSVSSASMSNTNYLVSTINSSANAGDVGITLYPNISYSGNYSILLQTPGCIQDNSCDLRSIVNVTVLDTEDNILSSELIYQNNDYDKFDYLFYGHLNGSASSEGGENKIQITYQEPVISGTSNPWIVVDKITANIVSLDKYYGNTTSSNFTSKAGSNISTITLNGLFEYSLSNFTNFDESLVKNTTNTFVGNSSINYLSGKLNSGSNITNIVFGNNSLVVLGNFSVNDTSKDLTNNILTLAVSGYDTSLNETDISTPIKRFIKRDTATNSTIYGALFNNTIDNVVELDNGLIFMGDFTATSSNVHSLTGGSSSEMNNFALYANNSWFSFGNRQLNSGFSQLVNITLKGVEYFVFKPSGNGTSQVWDNTNSKWISNDPYNLNDISAAANLQSKQQILGSTSSFNIMDLYSIDQATINAGSNNSFTSFNFNVSSTNGTSFISDSLYINSTLSVLGGSFNTTNGLSNLVLINNGTVQQLNGKITWNDSVVQSFYGGPDTSNLFIGTNDSIIVDGSSKPAGVVIYNLTTNAFADIQPAALSLGSNNLSVNALAFHDSDSKLAVGGNFQSAGSLDCPGLCIYDVVNTRWLQPTNNNSIGGSSIVNDIKFFTIDQILLGGLISYGGQQQRFIAYNFVSQVFEPISGSINSLSSTVSKFIMVDNNGNVGGRFLAYGDNFISGFNGENWISLDSDINYTSNTLISDMKLLTLNSSNSQNNGSFFNKNQALMVTGAFQLKDYGLVNAAVYNGTNWIPYAYTTSPKSSSTLGLILSILINDSFGFQSSAGLKNVGKFMSKGKVVGVSLACAIGSTIFISLLYLIPYFALFRKSKNDLSDQRIREADMMGTVNPEDLLHEMDMQKR